MTSRLPAVPINVRPSSTVWVAAAPKSIVFPVLVMISRSKNVVLPVMLDRFGPQPSSNTTVPVPASNVP